MQLERRASLGLCFLLASCATHLDPISSVDSSTHSDANGPAPDSGEGLDAAVIDTGEADSGADSGLPEGPALAYTAESFAAQVDEISEHGMIASSIASIVTEIASDPVVSNVLALRGVPHGDVVDRADVTERAENLPDCAGGTNHLDQCPVVIECGRRTLVTYGEGCLSASGKRLSGSAIITRPILASQPWRWDLALAMDSGDRGRIGFQGALGMTQESGILLFNQRSDAIRVSLPRRSDRRLDRVFGLLLSDISVTQGTGGEFQVRGPDTYTIDVPVTCGGSSSSATFEIENCGEWTFPVPLTSCLCPISGHLRLIGPLLDPCEPSERQTLDLEFLPIDPQRACGQNMTAKAYFPDTQCERSCGACDDGTCLPRSGLCTNSIDVSSVVSGMMGWVCELPATACSSIFDGGACPTFDGSVPDMGTERDGGLWPFDGGSGDARPPDGSTPSDSGVDAGSAVGQDASEVADGGFLDAAADDASEPDASPRDAGEPDASPADASPADASPADVSHADANIIVRPDADSPPDGSDSTPDSGAPGSDAGQATTTISGHTFNRDNGQGLAGALVRAHSGASGLSLLGGSYSLSVPASGLDDLTATRLGSVGVRRYFTLTGGPLANADLWLLPVASADAMFAAVGATRQEGKGHVQIDIRPSPTVRAQTAEIDVVAGVVFKPGATGLWTPGATVSANSANAFVFFGNVEPGMISARVFGDTGECQSPDPVGSIEVSAGVITQVTFFCP